MENRFLVVIDVQNDFVTGALGTKEAEAVIPSIVEKVRNFKGNILFTQDTHSEKYLSTQEGKILPIEHCIEHTNGWKLVPQLEDLQKERGSIIYRKDKFGSLELAADSERIYQKGKMSALELIGLCTDVCVLYNALLLKTYLPEIPIAVDASCCAGTTPDRHRMALETMKSCQIRITNEQEGGLIP